MSVKQIKGFSLIEVMTVVIIIGITSAFVLPSVRDFMVRSRINTAADQLTGLLMYARTQAASKQRPVFITRTTTTLGDRYDVQLGTVTAPVLASYLAPSGTKTVIASTPVPASAAVFNTVVYQPSGLFQAVDATGTTVLIPALDWRITICDSSVINEGGRVINASRMGRLSNRVNTLTTICFAN